jgi:DNA-binding IclR family transcriptional regulator
MTRVLDIDDVLALVEERPMTSGELAELLELPADVVHRCLLAAGRAGTLKRVGTDRAWALPSVVAPSGAPRSVLRDRVDAAILDALAAAPLSSEQLIARLPHSKRTIPEQCAALEAAGRIRRVGHGIKTRWVRVDADASVLAQLPADMKARVLEVLQGARWGARRSPRRSDCARRGQSDVTSWRSSRPDR